MLSRWRYPPPRSSSIELPLQFMESASTPTSQTELPNWKRPFENEDFRGFFTWESELTARIGGHFYHACHEAEAQQVLSESRLALRSTYSISHPSYGIRSAPCVWCGLNYFNTGNHYGPVLLKFPLKRLEGRTFMVFRRRDNRDRYWFVQYEAGIPIFSRDDKPDRRVNPASYFSEHGQHLRFKDHAIYELVITQPVTTKGITVEGVNHPKCIAGKCGGSNLTASRSVVDKLARKSAEAHLKADPAIKRLLRRFPNLKGADVTLPR